jgi:uncharacterized membrane protein YhaH (DUF805 family)
MYWLAWAIFGSVYLAVGVFAVYMTYRENERIGHRSIFLIGISYFLCIVWPLLAVAMLVFARWRPAEFVPADRN